MKIIDNSGRGNCMYYAYAISLMYFLRQEESQTIDKIFTTLQLDEASKAELGKLLSGQKGTISKFNDQEIETIERILGAACRALAGNKTREEFLADPANSLTVAACTYGIARALKDNLGNELSTLIELPSTERTEIERKEGRPAQADALINAEIFKVAGMVNAMETFSKEEISAVLKEVEARKDSNSQLVNSKIMDQIIHEKTIEFLKADENKQLNRYVDHLKKEFVWGSDDTLLSLHRAIIVEKKNLANQWVADTAISLMILKDGKVNAWETPENTDIIINNRGNNHWVSSIPSRFLVEDSKLEALTEFKGVLENIIQRSTDFSSQALESESEGMSFINMLHELVNKLDKLKAGYSDEGMKHFISATSKLTAENLPSALNRKYLSEDISNFIIASWHKIKLAFATLISIVSPSLLIDLQANRPEEYGIKTDIKKAEEMFKLFKPQDQIKDDGNKNSPKPS